MDNTFIFCVLVLYGTYTCADGQLSFCWGNNAQVVKKGNSTLEITTGYGQDRMSQDTDCHCQLKATKNFTLIEYSVKMLMFGDKRDCTPHVVSYKRVQASSLNQVACAKVEDPLDFVEPAKSLLYLQIDEGFDFSILNPDLMDIQASVTVKVGNGEVQLECGVTRVLADPRKNCQCDEEYKGGLPGDQTPAVKKENKAWVAGAVIGPLFFILIIALAIFVYLRMKRDDSSKPETRDMQTYEQDVKDSIPNIAHPGATPPRGLTHANPPGAQPPPGGHPGAMPPGGHPGAQPPPGGNSTGGLPLSGQPGAPSVRVISGSTSTLDSLTGTPDLGLGRKGTVDMYQNIPPSNVNHAG